MQAHVYNSLKRGNNREKQWFNKLKLWNIICLFFALFGMTEILLLLIISIFGLSYHEIAAFLASFHDVLLSVRQVKRILRRLGLRRRLNQSDVGDVLHAVMHELNGSGSIVGYRAMHQRIRNNHGLVVTRETVRQVLKPVRNTGLHDANIKREVRMTDGT